MVRTDAINDRLSQYNGVLDTLYELAESGSSLAGIANGLYRQIDQAATVLGLRMALGVVGPLENLNRALQTRGGTLAGMIESCSMYVKNSH